MGLKNRILKLEKENRAINYVPVLFLDSEDDIPAHKHLISPKTVIFIDDVGCGDYEK